MSAVRGYGGMEHRQGAVSLPGLQLADFGYGGNDLPPNPEAVAGVVRSNLVCDESETWSKRLGSSAGVGARQLPHGLDLAA